MADKKSMKPVALAVGAALAGTFALGSTAFADTQASPFGMTKMSSGYMLGIVGEGSCGGDKEGKDKAEGSCGEGSCGGDKDKAEGSCGEGKDKAEGSCGEGSCGGDKEKSEGACGEGSCGGDKTGE